jgi:uncharacterized membrane protein HdeD (DUF308 family)
MDNNGTNTYGMNLEPFVENWGWFLTLGIALMVLGIIAVGMPFVATLAVETLLAWIFLIVGVVQTVHAFRSRKFGRFFFLFMLGLLYSGLGLYLLIFPLRGMVTLTVLLSIFFLLEGVLKIIHVWQVHFVSGRGWMLFSGVLSLVLGVLLLSGMPLTAFWAAGLIVGADLIFSGIAMVVFSLAARNGFPGERVYCTGNNCYVRL